MNKYINKLKKQNKLNISIDHEFESTFPIHKKPFIIAGPCSVESEEMISKAALQLKKLGVDALRGGVFKPCTYPVLDFIGEWKEGIRELGLKYLENAGEESGLPVVSEIMSMDQITDESLSAIDIIQVGTRNFQNYPLLHELSKLDVPILLKRGTWGTIDEILGASERILVGGNNSLAICLRGVVGAPSYRHVFPSTRWAPDIMMIPALKEFTNIPIIYDPSHSTGYRKFVRPISKAAIAAGADGLIIECHPDPKNSISDPDQAISYNELQLILEDIDGQR